MEKKSLTEKLLEISRDTGVFKAQVVSVSDISFDESLRSYCEANVCGMYGKNHTCPPTVGDVSDLIRKAQSYGNALVFQTVCELEDSFDIEGMQTAAVRHSETAEAIKSHLKPVIGPFLQLGAGGCKVCDTCSKADDEPCRFPDRAVFSLEACGINVTNLAEISGMQYINGQNTVTYFGAFLFRGAPG